MNKRVLSLGGYRRLLKAGNKLFEGDNFAKKAFNSEIRSHFYANSVVEKDDVFKQLMKDIDEAEDFIMHNFTQAKLTKEGNFETNLQTPSSKSLFETQPKCSSTKPTEAELTKT